MPSLWYEFRFVLYAFLPCSCTQFVFIILDFAITWPWINIMALIYSEAFWSRWLHCLYSNDCYKVFWTPSFLLFSNSFFLPTCFLSFSLLLYFSQNFDQNLPLSLEWLTYLLTQWFQSDRMFPSIFVVFLPNFLEVQNQDTVVFVIETLHNCLLEVKNPSFVPTAKVLSLTTKKILSRMKR